jgi:hypothetical protein
MNTIETNNAEPLTYGADLIKAERLRQIREEGWSTEHDATHTKGELAMAASCYANHAALQAIMPNPADFIDYKNADNLPHMWPWEADWWKPSVDPIKNLRKAGALVAAEMDRVNAQRITRYFQ